MSNIIGILDDNLEGPNGVPTGETVRTLGYQCLIHPTLASAPTQVKIDLFNIAQKLAQKNSMTSREMETVRKYIAEFAPPAVMYPALRVLEAYIQADFQESVNTKEANTGGN